MVTTVHNAKFHVKPYRSVLTGWTSTIAKNVIDKLYTYFVRVEKTCKLENGVSLFWLNSPEKPNTCIILTHGIGGSSDEGYIRVWSSISKAKGYACVVYNRRGVKSPLPKSSSIPTHSDVHDLDRVVDHVRSVMTCQIVLVGYSAGANHVTNCTHKEVSGIVGVASCYDLGKMVEYLTCNKDIDRFIAAQTNPFYKKNLSRASSSRSSSSHLQNDDMIARIVGYNNVDEYYKACASIERIRVTKIPTLLLTSRDDPLMDGHHVARDIAEIAEQNDRVMAVVTDKGGHMGWLSRWSEHVILDFVDFLLETNNNIYAATTNNNNNGRDDAEEISYDRDDVQQDQGV